MWDQILQHFAADADMENVPIDSTIVRTHPRAAGAQKSAEPEDQALGRSRGGFSTKIHVTVDALGNPLRVRLTAGQRHDSTQAQVLLEEYECAYVIADRSYAAESLWQ